MHNMPSCMHNTSSYKHNMPTCKHIPTASTACQCSCTSNHVSTIHVCPMFAVHAQYIMHNMPTYMHNKPTCHAICTHNLQMCTYTMPTCIHNTCIHNIDMHVQHAVMHACVNPPSCTFGKDFELAEKPRMLGNKHKGQMGEPLPTCQGPWDTAIVKSLSGWVSCHQSKPIITLPGCTVKQL